MPLNTFNICYRKLGQHASQPRLTKLQGGGWFFYTLSKVLGYRGLGQDVLHPPGTVI